MKLVCIECGRMYGRKAGQIALSETEPEARSAALLSGWERTEEGWKCGLDANANIGS